jgi:hypothetical protein
MGRNGYLLGVGCFGLALVMGCSGEYRTVDMQGRVSVDGKPASAGHVTFAPNEDDKGSGGMGRIQENGTYQLKKVPIGTVTFTIVPEEKTGKQVETTDPAGSKMVTDELLPMIRGGTHGRGRMNFTLDVNSNMKEYDFELTDK